MDHKPEEIMEARHAFVLTLVCACCLVAATSLRADYFDNFDDGEYGEDPAVWDIDDPCWGVSTPLGGIFYFDVVNGSFHLWAEPTYLIPQVLASASVNYGDVDPNTSETVWDDTTSHYMLTWVANGDAHTDPNEDGGVALLSMHGNMGQWSIFYLAYEFKDDRPWDGALFHIRTLSGIDTHELAIDRIRGDVDPADYDANDPNWLDPNNMWNTPGYMDEHNGFWMVMQFTSDGVLEDPNGKWFGAACWNGDKFDWDGTWTLSKDLSGDIDNDPDPNTSWWPEWYWSVGGSGIAAFGDAAEGFPAYSIFDNLEVRTGVFTNTWRTLTITMKDCCELNLDPNLPHPDGGTKRRYTSGTPVVLDTVVPCGNKVFKKWTIKGPNQSADPNYQVLSDTNEVVYLTMDGDYLVKATCKCGGGGIAPFAGMVLLALGVSLVLRRLT